MRLPSLCRGWRLGAALAVLAVPALSLSAEPAAAVAPGNASAEYVIGPGDTLDVYVYREEELSTQVPVRPDGRITTPLVEDMVAVGKTPSALARDMEKVLSAYIRTPKVSISVAEAVSARSQVRVTGNAVTPRALPFREGLTVLDVIIEVGGLSEFAAGNRAQLVRQEADGRITRKRVRLSDLLEKGDQTQNLTLKPGDQLVIPETRF